MSSEEAARQADERLVDRDFRGAGRSLEVVASLSIAVLLIVLGLWLSPVRNGDGHYYLAMLEGLSTHGSPAITESIRDVVKARVTFDPIELSLVGRDGNRYAAHFFGYSLLCVPAHAMLKAAGMDPLKAFQLTNAFIIGVTIVYVLVFASLPRVTRWLIGLGFLLSTGSIYFQWTHPEVFSAACVLLASVALVERRYWVAALLAALGSLQNPSAALLILAVLAAQSWGLGIRGRRDLLRRDVLVSLGVTAGVSCVALIPYLWSLFHFGMPNPIAGSGFIDYSLIGVRRLVSFVLDLNQGLIVGLPLLLWAVPAALLARVITAARERAGLLRIEDLLLIGFVLMALPTLGQINWNAGHSVFLRYAAWVGMAPLVWVAVVLGRGHSAWRFAGVVPALTLQFGMALTLGGFAVDRLPSYIQFMPWVVPLWSQMPHVYDPIPDIFYERLTQREAEIETPAVLVGAEGEMLRVLTKHKRLDQAGEEVCGPGGVFVAADERPESQPRVDKTERGYRYVTGRFVCRPRAAEAPDRDGG